MSIVRTATLEDASEILEIYKPYILHTAFTFENEVPSLQDFQARMEKYLQKYPWLLVKIEGKIAGYVYGSIHREREAYQWTCECSVYVANEFQGKGIGLELYSVLFEILKMQGFRNIYAGITIPNEPSERLHKKCGFQKFAEYPNIGCKFNAWHSVGWWRLQVNEYDLSPSPPLPFKKMSCSLYENLFHRAAQKIDANLKNLST